MLVQYAKTGLSTSSGVSTFSSDSGVTRCPGTLKSQPARLGEKNEIDVDAVERFARYGAVGRQRGNGAGSTGSELTAQVLRRQQPPRQRQLRRRNQSRRLRSAKKISRTASRKA